jgi:hypothetical protein
VQISVSRQASKKESENFLLAADSLCSIKLIMKTITRSIAAIELLLIFPAVLFMTALFARNVQPLRYEPARTAQRIVDWYAARPHAGLWMLLIALPLVVLATGCATLLRNWKSRPELRDAARRAAAGARTHLATLLVATATLAAGGVLAIVALHLLTD